MRRAHWTIVVPLLLGVGGCTVHEMNHAIHQPTEWGYRNARVYLIAGQDPDLSDGLMTVRDRLLSHRINAAVYSPADWLKVVVDIEQRPCEEAIVVGHGHGGFLALQVARHFAHPKQYKHIKAVITLDPVIKDDAFYHAEGPRDARGHHRKAPLAQTVPTNVGYVYNYVQRNPLASHWGAELATLRGTGGEAVGYDLHDPRVIRRNGQRLGVNVTALGVGHETIDNAPWLVDKVVYLCRRMAMTDYRYTPADDHPDLDRDRRPAASDPS